MKEEVEEIFYKKVTKTPPFKWHTKNKYFNNLIELNLRDGRQFREFSFDN